MGRMNLHNAGDYQLTMFRQCSPTCSSLPIAYLGRRLYRSPISTIPIQPQKGSIKGLHATTLNEAPATGLPELPLCLHLRGTKTLSLEGTW